jgi:hypothetical protein
MNYVAQEERTVYHEVHSNVADGHEPPNVTLGHLGGGGGGTLLIKRMIFLMVLKHQRCKNIQNLKSNSNSTSEQKLVNNRYIHTYTGCPRRKGQNFGRVFLRSNYTDITQNTYIQS